MQVIKKGTSRQGDTVLLQELLVHAGYSLTVDGDFGAGTERAVRDFQRQHDLVADGIVGAKTWMVFASQYPTFYQSLTQRFLTERDLQQVADELSVEVAAVKAVRTVEAGGTGFWGERPKILFERHWFWRKLKAFGLNVSDYRANNDDILSSRAGGYVGGVKEYDRLGRAQAIHAEAALESASWGLFQIMGFHWQALSYESVGEFVERMGRSEGEQLVAFGRFLQANRLVEPLRRHDWAAFARGYNGRGYKRNRYDEKLARAYAAASRAA